MRPAGRRCQPRMRSSWTRQPRASVLCLAILAAVPAGGRNAEGPAAAPHGFRLVDVAAEAGLDFVSLTGDGSNDYIIEANGNGAAVLDYDGDGDGDLMIISGSTLPHLADAGGDPIAALYRNDGDGSFVDVTAGSGLEERGWAMGVCAADYDRDGLPDLYTTAYGPNRLYRNDGDGTFSDVSAAAGVGDPRWSHGCAFGDYDGDGNADLYVANYAVFDPETVPARGPDGPCNYRGFKTFCGPIGLTPEPDALYRNLGDGTFDQVEIPAPAKYGLGVVLSDLDGDARPDFFVANDSQENYLFRNRRSGELEETALFAGVALNERGAPQASMGIAVGDYDNDGDFDLFVTNFSEDYNTLYRNHGGGFFADVSFPSGVAQPSMTRLGWGTLFLDLDNDGWLDLFVANGHVYEDAESFGLGSSYLQANQVLLNLRDGRFREVTRDVVADAPQRSSRGLAAGDVDGDGDLDLLVVTVNEPPMLLRNEGGNRNRWLRVTLAVRQGQRDPAGTRVTLSTTGTLQVGEFRAGGSYLSQSEATVHFGLGTVDRAERMEVSPPGGGARAFHDLPAGRTYVVPGGAY